MTCTVNGRRNARRRFISSLLIGLATAGAGGCGQLLTGTLRVSEGIGTPQPDGTLILMELITPLTREQTMARFSPSELQLTGIKETDVQDGTAVFATPWKQSGPSQGVFALAKPELRPTLNSGPSNCRPGGGCSYGGDAVAVRVIRSGAAGTRALYLIDSIVEPRTVEGDCYYIGGGTLYCKSLELKGWKAQDRLFLKLPDPK